MIEAVDYPQVLSQISTHPTLFQAAPDVIRTFVGKVVTSRLADDGIGLNEVVEIRALVGATVFEEALDKVPAAKVKALITRIDQHATSLSTAADRVRHVLALADGSIKISPPPVKKASKRSSKPKAQEPVAPQDALSPAGKASPEGESQPAKRRKRMSGRTAILVSDRR